MHKVVLLLGGNLGNRYMNICLAEELLSEKMWCTGKSPLYETEAWGGNAHGFFLNRVLEYQTEREPMEVLGICQQVENSLGRSRDAKWGDRTMDIDILYFDNRVVESPLLTIPHPFIPHRRFTLVPLAKLMPDFLHPILKRTQQELLMETGDLTEVREWSPSPE